MSLSSLLELATLLYICTVCLSESTWHSCYQACTIVSVHVLSHAPVCFVLLLNVELDFIFNSNYLVLYEFVALSWYMCQQYAGVLVSAHAPLS